MSLNRLIYYSAIIGGWSAFLGWMISEYLLNRGGGPDGGRLAVAMTCALVGGAIGTGLNLVAGMANAQWKQQIKRVLPGFIAGGLGGAIGGFLGDILFTSFHLPRALGWMIMGAGIGVVEGLYERSPAKLRNGLIGGAIGGLLGGFLFDPILALIASNSGMSSRATAFVILGMCIGILIGLVKVVFKEAWLTVLDGYRPGRQLILSEAQTRAGPGGICGTALHGPRRLPRSSWCTRGSSASPTAGSPSRTTRPATAPGSTTCGSTAGSLLNDGDVIRLGMNSIRFSERHRRGGEAEPACGVRVHVGRGRAGSRAGEAAAPVGRPGAGQAAAPGRRAGDTSDRWAGVQAAHPGRGASARTRAAAAPAGRATRPSGPAAPPPRAPSPVAAPPPRPATPATPAPRPAPVRAATKPAAAAPQPAVAAAPRPPATAPDGSPLCPSCGKAVPKGQNYCIVCDIYF